VGHRAPRKLLVDRVVFTVRTDHYAVVGPWTLSKLVSGVVDLPQGMASPRGFTPFTVVGSIACSLCVNRCSHGSPLPLAGEYLSTER